MASWSDEMTTLFPHQKLDQIFSNLFSISFTDIKGDCFWGLQYCKNSQDFVVFKLENYLPSFLWWDRRHFLLLLHPTSSQKLIMYLVVDNTTIITSITV